MGTVDIDRQYITGLHTTARGTQYVTLQPDTLHDQYDYNGCQPPWAGEYYGGYNVGMVPYHPECRSGYSLASQMECCDAMNDPANANSPQGIVIINMCPIIKPGSGSCTPYRILSRIRNTFTCDGCYASQTNTEDWYFAVYEFY